MLVGTAPDNHSTDKEILKNAMRSPKIFFPCLPFFILIFEQKGLIPKIGQIVVVAVIVLFLNQDCN